jgi:tRNA (adenine57-N1/adenine58-N1)-methyltransferase
VGEDGLLVSYERRADFADIARANVERFFGAPHPAWQLRVGDLMEVAGGLADVVGQADAPAAADPAEQADAGGQAALGDEPDAADPAGQVFPNGRPDHAGPADSFDRLVLDMLAPWEFADLAAEALIPGGVLCCYVATVTQLSRTVESIREQGSFDEPTAWESLVRGWHVDGLAVRPEHRMVGHTGFLITARRLAQGITAPPRRRRPAKGSREESDQ